MNPDMAGWMMNISGSPGFAIDLEGGNGSEPPGQFSAETTGHVTGTNTSFSPVSDEDLAMTLAEAVTFSLLMSFCICATIVGNILVILSVFTYKPLRSVQNFFIVSLAVADLAVAILVMPFNVANFVIGFWVFGAVFCNMWLTFDILTCTASILNLCAIALDRYYAIHDPINYAQKRTLKRTLITIAVVWAASALISIPPLIGWNNSSGNTLYSPETRQCVLTDEKGFVIYSASGSFYIPLFIMTFVYINIFIATRRRLRARSQANTAAKLRGLKAVYSDPATTAPEDEPSSTGTPEEDTPHTSSADSPQHKKHRKNKLLCVENKAVVSGRECNGETKRLCKGSPVKKPSPNNKQQNGAPKSQVHQFLEEKQRISLSKERRAARTMGIIMGAFVLCWLPFFLMYVIFPFCPACAANVDHRLVNFIVWLGYVNSTLNPIIYTIFNIDFRRAFKNLLQGKCRIV